MSGKSDPRVLQALAEQGAAAHRAGRLDEAARAYETVLKRNSKHFDALHLLGLLRIQSGRAEDGVALLRRAVRITPGFAPAQQALGAALNGLNRPGEAVVALDAAAALAPELIEVRFNRAVALRALGRREAALADLDAVLALKPDTPEAHNLRAVVLHELRRFDGAVAAYDAALALRPAYADGWNNRGVALGEAGRHAEALASHERAIALKPEFADAHYNRGVALDRLKRPAEALEALDAAVALQPAHARAHHNRGTALKALGRLEEALASYEAAVALNPAYAEAHSNRGLALRDLGRLDASLSSYDAALAADPNFAEAHLGRSLTLLLAGRLAEGWPEYEWRRATWPAERQLDPERAWYGQADLAGRRLFVRHEQGLGDTLQFARYLPRLIAMGAEVIVQVQAPLVPLLAPSLPGLTWLADGAPAPDFDFHCALMSLPLAFSTSLDKVPPPLALAADPARRAAFEARLGQKTRPRVGLAWSGNSAHANDANRSIAFDRLAPLLAADADWFALQTEIRDSDAGAFAAAGRVAFLGEALADFADTAALVRHMDLIITVDTSLAHLAGSLGKPTWILLPTAPDWRWLEGRADSPWYPSVRLFRQGARGDWDAVVAEVAAALGEEL